MQGIETPANQNMQQKGNLKHVLRSAHSVHKRVGNISI